jgi:hypothetical protein
MGIFSFYVVLLFLEKRYSVGERRKKNGSENDRKFPEGTSKGKEYHAGTTGRNIGGVRENCLEMGDRNQHAGYQFAG